MLARIDDLIGGAGRDTTVSGDAMRWSPERAPADGGDRLAEDYREQLFASRSLDARLLNGAWCVDSLARCRFEVEYADGQRCAWEITGRALIADVDIIEDTQEHEFVGAAGMGQRALVTRGNPTVEVRIQYVDNIRFCRVTSPAVD